MKFSNTLYTVFFLCLTLTFSFAQTEVNTPVESYLIGTLDQNEAELMEQDIAFQTWVTAHAGSSERGTATGFTQELVLDQRSGWNYQARWTEGNQQFLMRFQLIQNDQELMLLEVGSYQTAVCEGCTSLSFKADMPGCECETGTCEYLMGETLH